MGIESVELVGKAGITVLYAGALWDGVYSLITQLWTWTKGYKDTRMRRYHFPEKISSTSPRHS